VDRGGPLDGRIRVGAQHGSARRDAQLGAALAFGPREHPLFDLGPLLVAEGSEQFNQDASVFPPDPALLERRQGGR